MDLDAVVLHFMKIAAFGVLVRSVASCGLMNPGICAEVARTRDFGRLSGRQKADHLIDQINLNQISAQPSGIRQLR
jgi:hypothetical protein